MVSKVTLHKGAENTVTVVVSQNAKCERCWHYDENIGTIAEHPTICPRCVENVAGAGEIRQFV